MTGTYLKYPDLVSSPPAYRTCSWTQKNWHIDLVFILLFNISSSTNKACLPSKRLSYFWCNIINCEYLEETFLTLYCLIFASYCSVRMYLFHERSISLHPPIKTNSFRSIAKYLFSGHINLKVTCFLWKLFIGTV